jgi:hypothetical protein
MRFASRPRPTATDVAEVMSRVKQIPDSFRDFRVSAGTAANVFGVHEPLMRELLDNGLPHRNTGEDPLLDRRDLENIGLDLGLVCPQRTAMRWWSRCLEECLPGVNRDCSIVITLECPSPGHPGECDTRIGPPLLEYADHGYERLGDNAYQVNLSLTPAVDLFGKAYEPLIEEIRQAYFHILPDELGLDFGFFEATGLAECRLAALHFARVGRKQGIPVRSAAGLIALAPYPVGHHWLEFQMHGEWVAADPFLINAFHRWNIIDEQSWPLNRSPQGAFWRLSSDGRPLVLATHNGTEMTPKFSILP